jgi:hydrophobic/amphiphilic exporter-1 (mainly G- bacteria), HAE1 family
MRSIVKWSVANGPGINVMVIGVLVAGLFSFLMLRRETFPEFELEVVLVQVPYPGASPADAENGICQPIEEAVRALDGIKRIVSIAREGGGYVIVELNSNVSDVQKVVSEIRSRVDRITNFPELAEDPQVEQITFRQPAIRLAVIGPKSQDRDAELKLREVTESIRASLLDLPQITQATLLGAKPFQIDVEISEDTLRKHGLTLSRVAQILRRENIEMPGGQMRAEGQEILLRGKNRREIGEDIKELPLITQPNGVVLKIQDIGEVRDEFDDSSNINEVNGLPAMVISIDRSADEDLLAMADAVHKFAETAEVPPGFSLRVWGDTSTDVRDRMRLLITNGFQGLLLVFVLLSMFLEFRLAFWVSMGIPISVFGAAIVLLATGQTLNMLSMFAFLMALGIVVDDAIVVGENIYSHRATGKNFVDSAIDGTIEVLPSVISSVATTVIAFIPFFFVSGVMGKFIAVMPVAIIAMLTISLVEASTSLPTHLSHGTEKPKTLPAHIISFLFRPFKPLISMLDGLSHRCGAALEWVAEYVYLPMMRFILQYPLLGVSIAFSMLLLTFGMVRAGYIPFNAFPKSDSNQIIAQIVYPDGTPVQLADEATQRIERAIRNVSERLHAEEQAKLNDNTLPADITPDPLNPKGPVKLTFRQVGQVTAQGAVGSTQNNNGSNVGQVSVELRDAAERSISSNQLISLWRKEAGEFTGAERVTFDSASVGPGGNPIEFKMLAPSSKQAELESAVEMAKRELANYAGVYDIRDDATPGKTEFQIKVKESAQSMGITSADLADTIRNAYYGAEVMRMQRGRHEVKLMVRYPESERTSLAQFHEIRVRGNDNIERPITELAEITTAQGYSEINRLDQQRSITIITDLDATETNAQQVIDKLKSEFLPKLATTCPSVSVRWEGQQQQTQESTRSLFIGSALALLAMYVLLVVEFKSYFQPLIILAIVPFGVIGAVWGHGIMGIEVTLFSFFGLVALTGVVVNDSIVLVDFINAKVRSGMDFKLALTEAGRRRLRPVFLTSVTTIGGLAPMLLETSFQAQFLVPMATSIAFGLMLSTFLVLFQVPVFFSLYLTVANWFGFDPSGMASDIPPPDAIPEPVDNTRPVALT